MKQLRLTMGARLARLCRSWQESYPGVGVAHRSKTFTYGDLRLAYRSVQSVDTAVGMQGLGGRKQSSGSPCWITNDEGRAEAATTEGAHLTRM
jgi:hypothetical protein